MKKVAVIMGSDSDAPVSATHSTRGRRTFQTAAYIASVQNWSMPPPKRLRNLSPSMPQSSRKGTG